MTPLKCYQQDLLLDNFHKDEAQEHAIKCLQKVYDDLIKQQSARQSINPLLKWWQDWRSSEQVPVQGVYMWGGVGRGKTYLMDTFYHCLPIERKMRTHFHRFMQRVQNDLVTYKGRKNPLELIADDIAAEASVLCFDEFFVSDIGDAMILAGLLQALFARQVCLVTTSNIEPGGLYQNGLQRVRFLPAIELIKKYTNIINVDGGVDYRLRALQKAEIYHSPLDEKADISLQKSFDSLTPEHSEVFKKCSVEVLSREIQCRCYADDVAWFDFAEICGGPRSQNDYIELGKLFHAVLISNVPIFTQQRDDEARRFINLVDEFYDRGVKLILSAEAPLNALYQEGNLQFEFQRTVSRLLEMQSYEYLGKQHIG